MKVSIQAIFVFFSLFVFNPVAQAYIRPECTYMHQRWPRTANDFNACMQTWRPPVFGYHDELTPIMDCCGSACGNNAGTPKTYRDCLNTCIGCKEPWPYYVRDKSNGA